MHAHARTCLRLLQPCMCLMSAHSAPVLACAETDQHIVTNILLDVSSIKGMVAQIHLHMRTTISHSGALSMGSNE